MARVKLDGKSIRELNGRSNIRPAYATLLSVYAPTHRSPQERKDKFYAGRPAEYSGLIVSIKSWMMYMYCFYTYLEISTTE